MVLPDKLDDRKIRNLQVARENLAVARKEVCRGLKARQVQLHHREDKLVEARSRHADVVARVKTFIEVQRGKEADMAPVAEQLSRIVEDLNFIGDVKQAWETQFHGRNEARAVTLIPDFVSRLAALIANEEEAVALQVEHNFVSQVLAHATSNVEHSKFAVQRFEECLLAASEVDEGKL